MLHFTTWFRSPALQMAGYEQLARASCSLVAALPAPAAPPGALFLLASQHVTHPHAFRRYFPAQDFLEVVADQDLRYSVEVCQEGTGEVLARHRLPAALPLLRHASRDCTLLALGVDGGSALLQAVARRAGGQAQAQAPLAPLQLAAAAPGGGGGEAREGAPLALAGHFLLGSGEAGAMLPRRLSGAVVQRSASQAFLRTSAVLEMGMCGGPVVGASGALVGIVEGLVPLLREGEGEGGGGGDEDAALSPLQRKSRQLLGGTAVMVEASDLRELLAEGAELLR